MHHPKSLTLEFFPLLRSLGTDHPTLNSIKFWVGGMAGKLASNGRPPLKTGLNAH